MATTNGTSPSIPIVDFTDFKTETDPETRLKIAQELVAACREVGFVYITNHSVPEQTLSKAFSISKKFYDLSEEDKMKAPHPPGWAVHRGYSWPGLEKVSGTMSTKDDEELIAKLREVQDYKESYEIGSEQDPDMPNVWPPDEVLPEWRPFMTNFYWVCWEAAQQVLRALALGIGLEDENHLLKLHSGHHNQLRLLHYPPVPAKVIEGGKMSRMPAHTDWSTMTMLFQDDCGGLQVEDPHKPGEFIDVPPVPGSLVMNVGDLLMRWSNGSSLQSCSDVSADLSLDYLRSTSHQVTLPPRQDRFTGDDRLTRARYSIPYFVTTDPDLLIECLRIDGEHPPKYDPITQRDYSAMRARMQYWNNEA